MPVIAMTQEMGSLAKDIAVHLAKTQNLAVMKHEIIDHLAEKMDLSKSVIRRLREGKAGFVDRITTDDESMALYTAEEVFDLARKGNVILRGWGATCLLRPVPHVVTVRVTRSMSKRVEWLMAHLETDDADFAEAEIRRSDAAHSARMQQQFGVEWGDPILYDLVLNTDRLSIESCASQILSLVGRPEFQESAASQAVLENMALETHVRAALRSNPASHDVRVTIEANAGRVVLSGIVLHADELIAAERVASAVTGVVSVDNQLRLMANSKLYSSGAY
ncbi:cytidylate kinase family protein [Herminiimonas sp. NPDC097707]|uniref:cytidylate kinase family protein n=1 Tax=Herminiimonas sp. NPDC097707 TaxID=3364007 RepID=UPI00383AC2FA